MKFNINRPPDVDVEVQRSKEEIVNDMCDLIRRIPLKTDQIRALYDSVSARLISKTCHSCGKFGLEIEGSFIYPGGDLSKPKQFICRRCK